MRCRPWLPLLVPLLTSAGCGRTGYDALSGKDGGGQVSPNRDASSDASDDAGADAGIMLAVGACPAAVPQCPLTSATIGGGSYQGFGDSRLNGGGQFAASCGGADAAEGMLGLTDGGTVHIQALAGFDVVLYVIGDCGGTVISECVNDTGPGEAETLDATIPAGGVIVIDSGDGQCGQWLLNVSSM